MANIKVISVMSPHTCIYPQHGIETPVQIGPRNSTPPHLHHPAHHHEGGESGGVEVGGGWKKWSGGEGVKEVESRWGMKEVEWKWGCVKEVEWRWEVKEVEWRWGWNKWSGGGGRMKEVKMWSNLNDLKTSTGETMNSYHSSYILHTVLLLYTAYSPPPIHCMRTRMKLDIRVHNACYSTARQIWLYQVMTTGISAH